MKTFPLDNFHKNKATKDGHSYRCKSCVSAAVVAWQKNNIEKVKATRKEWRSKNPKHRSEWLKKNPEKRDKYTAKRYFV